MELTPEIMNALDMMRDSSKQFVFLSGNAGTGKSTVLREYLQELTDKNVNKVVLAPTGIAAMNVGGMTIHKFFELPLAYLTPELAEYSKLSIDKRKVIKALDVLIIDEISMVRSDIMDAIDIRLRMAKELPLPFGGVKIIAVGDLHQIEPVVNKEDAKHFKGKSAFFFTANVFNLLPIHNSNLTFVFRQSDAAFINALNDIRIGGYADDTAALLNTRLLKNIEFDKNGALYLCTTNKEVERINSARLAELDSSPYTYEAIINGQVNIKDFSAPVSLTIKIGSQVMTLVNNNKYVNGSIGTITNIYEDEDGDECIDIRIDDVIHTLRRYKWVVKEYRFENNSVIEDEVGSYTQFPIQLAWAITIHKSQGLTLDKVIINLGSGAFAHGQLYVALSRCRSLDGLALVSKVYASDVILNDSIMQYLPITGETVC